MVRRRPQELVDRYGQVIDHIAANYRASWDSWARPSLDLFLPPVDDQDDPTDDGRLSAAPGPPDSRPETPDPSTIRVTRKRTAVVRSPPSPEAAANPRKKRSRPQTALAAASTPSAPVPSPFPSSISGALLRTIRAAKAEDQWVTAAKRSGVMKGLVRGHVVFRSSRFSWPRPF
jgi:hypothetical protein